MGCVWSKKGDSKKGLPCPIQDGIAKRKSNYREFDSGELAILPAKIGAGKLLETSIGRASLAGLERAVEVLDTLGSSMTSLNTGSGFISGATNRGNNKISILSFEVANTIAKAASLWKSFSDESIRVLKQDVLRSDGVRLLVSSDYSELLRIAAADKRDELAVFAKEVIRFGDLCKDPVWHNLGRYFQKLDSDLASQDQLTEEMETTVHQLIDLAQNTNELYHELHALDRFEQDYHRKFHEEKSLAAARKESLMILLSELKRQRKLVRSLQKKSLWSRNLEEIVEKLVDIVVYLNKQIRDAFGPSTSNNNFTGSEQTENNRTLGACGLALHYANIINQIDNIVCRPLSLPPSARDNLYHGLPNTVKSALRSRLHSLDDKEEYTVAQIKNEMQKTLSWIIPMAENTIRAHQGFGWVGEWANVGTEINNKPGQHSTTLTKIETLHHADKLKTENYILELVIWLHLLVVQVKNRGYGYKASRHNSTRYVNSGNVEIKERTKDCPSSSPLISELERELLDNVSDTNVVVCHKRSKSWDAVSGSRETIRVWGVSRSCGSSPARKIDIGTDLEMERTRVLDVMDGLDMFCN